MTDAGRPVGARLPRPRAIVFDCDGLLLDTEPCWTVAETEVFGRRGLGYGPEEKARFIGRSVPATAALMATIFDEPGNQDAILAELLESIGDVIASHAQPMPGALDLLQVLAGRLPLGVASNSPRVVLDGALRRAGLLDAFGAVVAADEVPAPKPAPDLYLGACRLLGVRPQEAIAFEDTGTGTAAAHAAGLRVVGVPSPEAGTFAADWLVTSLDDPGLLAWAASL